MRKKTDLPDVVKDEFIDNPEIYKKLSNKTTQAKADSILQKGTEYAEKEFNRLLANMDAVAIPLGYNLSKEYISAGQQDRGVGLFGSGAKALQATATQKYSSIDEIKADKNRLKKLSTEEYEKILESLDERIDKVVRNIQEYNNDVSYMS